MCKSSRDSWSKISLTRTSRSAAAIVPSGAACVFDSKATRGGTERSIVLSAPFLPPPAPEPATARLRIAPFHMPRLQPCFRPRPTDRHKRLPRAKHPDRDAGPRPLRHARLEIQQSSIPPHNPQAVGHMINASHQPAFHDAEPTKAPHRGAVRGLLPVQCYGGSERAVGTPGDHGGCAMGRDDRLWTPHVVNASRRQTFQARNVREGLTHHLRLRRTPACVRSIAFEMRCHASAPAKCRSALTHANRWQDDSSNEKQKNACGDGQGPTIGPRASIVEGAPRRRNVAYRGRQKERARHPGCALLGQAERQRGQVRAAPRSLAALPAADRCAGQRHSP